ncbi:type II and III secretion system protein family protein [Brevundimonas lenta]|uniref:Pilus assembly protein CpaC n=1 Tax=Brevundimonas lenta TaxID=424796 RepID=A0A7W6NNG4_9CAUL|nr:type II and III secretion system protein family protein [Brevundimonas lenta]MBB4081768.1 pilus assembly protein CpaC [Brevundimonas lenta]
MNRMIAVAMAALTVVATSPVTPVQAQSRAAVSMGSQSQLISLPRGSSMAVDLPADARDVIVPNPGVAEAMLHSPRRITIIGLAPGETDAVVLDNAGRTILSLRVRVDAGVSALQDTLDRIMPGSNVHAEAVNDSVVLTGTVYSPGEADRASQVARAFVAAPEKVINMMTIAGSDQVMVKARIVEVQRSAVKQLGLSTDVVVNQGTTSWGMGRANSFAVNGALLGGGGVCFGEQDARTTNISNSVGSTVQTGSGTEAITTVNDIDRVFNIGGVDFIDGTITNSTTSNSTSNVLSNLASTVFKTVTGTNASACLAAFERVGLVRTLAEPNLTSVNGENAEFLAGGEFPVPVGRDDDGNITIAFKPYGVRLAFRPIVLSEGRISLQLSTEVSELTTNGAFTLGATGENALVIPALNVRRTSNTVELPSGGSLMIAGMLREDTRQNIDTLPGIGELPVLGALFRSRDYLSGETELVIIVEAYIVSPTSAGSLQTPADGLIIANDAQTILFGQLNQHYAPRETAQAAPAAGWSGPVGYVIE